MKYTVVMLRPPKIAEPEGLDVYTAFTSATTIKDAVQAGQLQVFRADSKDLGKAFMKEEEIEPEHYKMLIVFEGHQTPVGFGWQSL